MDETEIKTRQGLILENVLAAALTKAGFSFDQDVQYDETCEKPDFLIPNQAKPKFMVEVHQTEARNSFQMKTLRAFTAVTESKAHFGNKLVSVNVLFGDPDNELPASNVKAMCGIFDVNIIPRRDADKPDVVRKMEVFALTLAKDEEKKTEAAGKEVVKAHPVGVAELAVLIKKEISAAKARPELDELWDLERQREKSLGEAPKSGDPTYYKRCMLWALFLNDQDFSELQKNKDPGRCSDSVKKQLLATRLAAISEEMDGDYYTLKAEFAAFLKDPECIRLRSICKDVLDAEPAMKWFFEDIRDAKRRALMAKNFLAAWTRGFSVLQQAFVDSFENGNALGVAHERCWVGDLLPILLGRSHNFFNNLVRNHPDYPTSLGNPYNNIVIRSARLGKEPDQRMAYCRVAWEVFESLCVQMGVSAKDHSEEEVADMILGFRASAAIKLQKLDPLYLMLLGIANRSRTAAGEITVSSIASDLSGDNSAGDFMTYYFADSSGKKVVLSNAVAVHDGHGDDKSKEWGARRLATLYRMEKGQVRRSDYQVGVFVIDGEWKDKDVARLYRSGWTHVVRMAELEATLQSVFGLHSSVAVKAATPRPIKLPALANLPLAAEAQNEAPKLKRKGGHG
jgi:hypothetical protein